VAKYNVNGQYVYGQHLMGGCGSTAEYGTAVSVQKGASYSEGGFFGGHYDNSIGFNENHPSSELVINSSNTSSFFGEHMWDECTGPFVVPTVFPPSGPALEFSAAKLSPTIYRIDFFLPPGQYMIAYRDPTTSKPHACIDYPNFTSPGWNLHPFTHLSFGTGFQNVTVPTAGVVYDWYIQGQCNGRWAAIDPNNSISLKPGHLDVTSTELENAVMEAFPNPFAEQLTVKLNLSQAGPVAVRILDVAGKDVIRQDEKEYPAGLQNISISTTTLSAGIYTVMLTTEKDVYTSKVVCSK